MLLPGGVVFALRHRIRRSAAHKAWRELPSLIPALRTTRDLPRQPVVQPLRSYQRKMCTLPLLAGENIGRRRNSLSSSYQDR